MGRTVYGVDLEESPFGGLIEKLLTEEELEKLADGGTPAQPGGRGAAPDGGDDADDDDESGDGNDSDGDAEDEDDDWTVSDDTFASKGDADDSVDDTSTDDAGPGASDPESWSPSSPPPSTAPDDGPDFGSESGYGGSTGFGAGASDDDDGGSFLSKHKWLLLKVAIGLAALAAVALVVWRFKDRLAGLVPGRGGGDDVDEFDVDGPGDADANEDVSPARRRAKVDESAPDASDETEERDDDAEERPRRPPRRERTEGVETPGQDLDLGALVGLGMLAFVAALVRKYDEERTRPHDPLVDGPLDDEVMDDDQ